MGDRRLTLMSFFMKSNKSIELRIEQIFYIGSIFGVFTHREKKWKLVKSRWSLLLTIIVCIFINFYLIAFFYSRIKAITSGKVKTTLIRKIILAGTALTLGATCLNNIANNYLRGKDLCRFLSDIRKAKDILQEFFPLEKETVYIPRYAVGLALCTLYYSHTIYIKYSIAIYLTVVFYYISGIITFSIVFVFCDLLEIINFMFDGLTSTIVYIESQEEKLSGVIQLVRAHSLLYNASKALCRYFSLTFLFIAASIFISLIASCYQFLKIGFRGSFGVGEIFLGIYWFTWYSYLGITLTTMAKETSEKAMEFNSHLYQLMIDDKTNSIANNKKICLHIAMKREFVFMACGFFNLDYTWIHSVIAALSTYVVIVLQFAQTTSGFKANYQNEEL